MNRSTWMVILFLAASAVLQVWVHVQSRPPRSASIERGAAAPALEATDLEGVGVALDELRGKIVILDFWATWCGPCRAEFRTLEAWWKRESDTGLLDDVVVLAVNVGEPRELARRFAQKHGIPFRVVTDEDGALASRYGVAALPTLVVIDRDGKVLDARTGFDPDVGGILSVVIRGSLKQEPKS